MSRENSGLTIKINEIAFLDIFYKSDSTEQSKVGEVWYKNE
jgi:hypothetical protein